jgi:hypothetical protein
LLGMQMLLDWFYVVVIVRRTYVAPVLGQD